MSGTTIDDVVKRLSTPELGTPFCCAASTVALDSMCVSTVTDIVNGNRCEGQA